LDVPPRPVVIAADTVVRVPCAGTVAVLDGVLYPAKKEFDVELPISSIWSRSRTEKSRDSVDKMGYNLFWNGQDLSEYRRRWPLIPGGRIGAG